MICIYREIESFISLYNHDDALIIFVEMVDNILENNHILVNQSYGKSRLFL